MEHICTLVYMYPSRHALGHAVRLYIVQIGSSRVLRRVLPNLETSFNNNIKLSNAISQELRETWSVS